MHNYHEIGDLDEPLRVGDGQENIWVDGVPKRSKSRNTDTKICAHNDPISHIDALHHFSVWRWGLGKRCLQTEKLEEGSWLHVDFCTLTAPILT